MKNKEKILRDNGWFNTWRSDIWAHETDNNPDTSGMTLGEAWKEFINYGECLKYKKDDGIKL